MALVQKYQKTPMPMKMLDKMDRLFRLRQRVNRFLIIKNKLIGEMLMLTGTIKNQRWSKLAALFLVLTLVAGLVGFSVVNSVFAQTDEVLISLNGGSGVRVTASQINSLTSPNNNWTYSSLNSFGTKRFYSTKGAPLEDVLLAGGVDAQDIANAVTIEITTEDGFASFSAELLLRDVLNYYPNLLDDSYEDEDPVPTIIATASKQGKEDYTNLSTSDSLRLFRGQFDLDDVNNPDFAKWITEINVITQ